MAVSVLSYFFVQQATFAVPSYYWATTCFFFGPLVFGWCHNPRQVMEVRWRRVPVFQCKTWNLCSSTPQVREKATVYWTLSSYNPPKNSFLDISMFDILIITLFLTWSPPPCKNWSIIWSLEFCRCFHIPLRQEFSLLDVCWRKAAAVKVVFCVSWPNIKNRDQQNWKSYAASLWSLCIINQNRWS